jgi:type VI secretion system protein VasD
MKSAFRWLWWFFLGASLLLLAACPKQPARVNMTVVAAPNVNPDSSGQALSVVVRIYQLKDKGRLEAADYNAILKSDKETLGEDFLDRQERVVQPGTQETLEIKTHPMTAFIGVVALFRNPAGEGWRRVIPISGKNPKLNLSLREQSIELLSAAK